MNMVIHTWCALIITSFWKGLEGFHFWLLMGMLGVYSGRVFGWLYPFWENKSFCAPFFSQLRSTKFSTPRVAGYVFWNDRKTSWNILTSVRNEESSNVRYLRSLWTREISLCSCCWLVSSDLASLSSFIFTDLDVEGSGCHAHGRVHWRGSTPGESFWTTLISEPWSFYSRKNGQWPSWPLSK